MILELALVGIGVYALSKAGGGVSPTPQTGAINAGAPTSPITSPRPDGIPVGTVTLGGQPATSGWNPNTSIAQKALGLTSIGIGAIGSLSKGITAIGTALGGTIANAIPIAGSLVGVATGIVGAITAHHKQALATEGATLNQVIPKSLNAMILVAQGVISGEIRTSTEAYGYLDQIKNDYYTQVHSIKQGTWPFGGALEADYQTVWVKRTQQSGSDYHAPNPCNAACVMGHFFIERNIALTKNAITTILSGKHGDLIFPQIPSYETQAGFPEVRMAY